MNERMTIAEIEARFVDEWILLGDPETDEYARVQSGVVLFHGKDRDEMYAKAVELRPKRFATLYTRKVLPENTAIVL
jgi:hypothetical protein